MRQLSIFAIFSACFSVNAMASQCFGFGKWLNYTVWGTSEIFVLKGSSTEKKCVAINRFVSFEDEGRYANYYRQNFYVSAEDCAQKFAGGYLIKERSAWESALNLQQENLNTTYLVFVGFNATTGNCLRIRVPDGVEVPFDYCNEDSAYGYVCEYPYQSCDWETQTNWVPDSSFLVEVLIKFQDTKDASSKKCTEPTLNNVSVDATIFTCTPLFNEKDWSAWSICCLLPGENFPTQQRFRNVSTDCQQYADQVPGRPAHRRTCGAIDPGCPKNVQTVTDAGNFTLIVVLVAVFGVLFVTVIIVVVIVCIRHRRKRNLAKKQSSTTKSQTDSKKKSGSRKSAQVSEKGSASTQKNQTKTKVQSKEKRVDSSRGVKKQPPPVKRSKSH